PGHNDNNSSGNLPPLQEFLSHLVHGSKLTTGILSFAMILIRRIEKGLQPKITGTACSKHQIVLTALIISDKWCSDVCFKNRSWVFLSDMTAYGYGFKLGLVDLSTSERQFLALLNWNL
ncbi:hypothetical protein QBC38DRAFT_342319, partial [Podospora fimiseda]